MNYLPAGRQANYELSYKVLKVYNFLKVHIFATFFTRQLISS
jgi:hypothetical protein